MDGKGLNQQQKLQSQVSMPTYTMFFSPKMCEKGGGGTNPHPLINLHDSDAHVINIHQQSLVLSNQSDLGYSVNSICH